jgi:fatty acid desaturase
MNENIKINWYRCKVDKKVMSELMKTSDARALRQVIPQLALFAATGTLAYLAFLNVHASNWKWSMPLLLAALFLHGTFSSFLGLVAVHELCHKTPFRSKRLNEFFLKVFSFISWSDYVGFRVSHVKHHQVTVHDDLDGEVTLPAKLDWESVKFYLVLLTCDPVAIFRHLRGCAQAAFGELGDWFFSKKWLHQVMPESNAALRREHRCWARTLFLGHLALAILFIATGNWFLIVIFTFSCFYCRWLQMLCGTPQHIGMSPNVPYFRLCCRTYTCGWLPAFLYWNMQYHVEHHMFPAVPFYNLPKLRKAIEHDLPPATHGLWVTWKEIISIVKRQKKDPAYVFIPELPSSSGDRVGDTVLELEAALSEA